MTSTLPGADIRAFYAELGIFLPAHATDEASVRCFVNPDGHRREDRGASCSVNLISGAWNCHGCGLGGGAYDAAWRLGRTPRGAMDLLVRYGLAERHLARRGRERTPPRRPPPARASATRVPDPPRVLHVTERDVERWQTALWRRPSLSCRLGRERGWRRDTIRELELGLDHGRITIPVRGQEHQLHGLLRYDPWPSGERPKMRAAFGTRLGLLPHPAGEASEHVLLVEGPPDMIAARSRGLAAIAVPGAEAWQPEWAALLAGRHVTIIMDSDPAGRGAATRIADDLTGHADVAVVDLAPEREDGYDLTDWLLEHPGRVNLER